MKVFISGYIDPLSSDIYSNHIDRKYGLNPPEQEDKEDKFYKTIDTGLEWLYDHTINPAINYFNQRTINGRIIKIKIDRSDAFSADVTLAHIIHPMLVEIKKDKMGIPKVDEEDLPEHLKGNLEEKMDDDWMYHEKKWEYIMDEMIRSFEYIKNDKLDDMFINANFGRVQYEREQARIRNGLRLFAKYYFSLWT